MKIRKRKKIIKLYAVKVKKYNRSIKSWISCGKSSENYKMSKNLSTFLAALFD